MMGAFRQNKAQSFPPFSRCIINLKTFSMKKGSWVVCINDSNWSPNAHTSLSSLPVKNRLYRVRKLFPGISEVPGIAVDGIFGKYMYHRYSDGIERFIECHFFGWRFREVALPPAAGFDEREVVETSEKKEAGKKKRKLKALQKEAC
jgi:hypothetical protein